MKAVILAAGKSSRLKKNCNKTLCKFYGLPVIEKILSGFKKAGINDFIIVTGYKADELKKWLSSNKKRLNIKYRIIHNEKWNIYDNAYSLLIIEPYIKDSHFILSMGDHVVDYKVIKTLIDVQSKETVLAVDTTPASFIDVKEATKVKIKEGKIYNIGKKLKKYDGIDMGIFRMNKKLFPYLKKAINNGKTKINDALKLYAKENNIIAVEFENIFWIDLDTTEDFKKARQGFYRLLVKESDGPISKFINRRFSIPISAFLSNFNISPNFISFISFSLAAFSGFLFASGKNIFAAILTQISSIADGIDGEIARLKFKESKWGEMLDTILDRTGDFIIISGISYNLFIMSPSLIIFLLSLLSIFSIFLPSFSSLLYKKLQGVPPSKVLLDTRDVRLFLIFLFMLFSQNLPLLIVLNSLIIINFFRRMYFFRKTLL